MQRFLFLALLALVMFALPARCAEKIYGGFSVGQKFTFKVTDRSARLDKKAVPFSRESIPKDVPIFRKGQPVTFTIGPNGELKLPGKLSIPFLDSQITQNNYNGKSGKDGAAVFKEPFINRPIRVNLSYIRTVGKKTLRVYYDLK